MLDHEHAFAVSGNEVAVLAESTKDHGWTADVVDIFDLYWNAQAIVAVFTVGVFLRAIIGAVLHVVLAVLWRVGLAAV
jgi:hypothetical protein